MVLFYLIQTYGSNPGLFDLPLTIYLKDNLHLPPAELATFGSLVILPWTIKPLYGIIADVFPIFGYRFKSYFLICYTLAFVCLLGLSSIQNHTIQNLAISMVLISTCIAFSDVLTDKIMIVEGSINNNTARLQAAQWAGLGFESYMLQK